MTSRDGVASRLREGYQSRVRRVLTPHLAPSIRVLLIASQLLVVVLCVMVLTGWRGPAVTNDFTGALYWPWQALITVLAMGILATCLGVVAVRSRLPARLALSAGVVVLTLLAVDAVPLGPLRAWLCGLMLMSAVVGLLLPSRGVWETIRCILVLAPFVVAFFSTLSSTGMDQALVAIRAQQLAPFAAVGLSMLAIFSVASAVEGQRERSARLLTGRITIRAVWITLLVKALLLLALYFRLTGDFLGGEAMWRPRLQAPLSWLHAVVVAVVIVGAALLTLRRPLIGRGFTSHLAALVLCLAAMESTFIAASGIVTAASAVAPTADLSAFFLVPSLMIDNAEFVQLVGVVALLVSALLVVAIWRRVTTGTFLWLIAGIWLVPPLLGIAFATSDSPAAWAAPGQVDTLLTVVVLALLLTRRPRTASPRILMLLLVVPLVVLYWPTFWPGEWTNRLLPLAVVGAVVVALWLNPPPVYADRQRNERVRALLLGGQLTVLILYVYLLNSADLAGGLDSSSQIAWLWLGIPFTAVLTARVAGGAAGSRSEPAQEARAVAR